MSINQSQAGMEAVEAAEAGDSTLRVFPPSVEFHSISAGPIFVMQINIQNADSVSRRVRVAPPQTRAFRVRALPVGAIAPGLDMRAEIEFRADAEQEYHDRIYISLGKNMVELPLHAYPPAPRVRHPQLLNFGAVIAGQSATTRFKLWNEGDRPASIELVADPEAGVRFQPSTLQLEASPAEADSGTPAPLAAVEATFTAPNAPGNMRALAEVRVEGQPTQVLDLAAAIVEHKLELRLPDPAAEGAVSLGTVFFGERKEVEAVLVNDGPRPATFTIAGSASDGDNDRGDGPSGAASSDGASPRQGRSQGRREPPLSVVPAEGTVGPYDSVPLRIVFAPRRAAPSGFRGPRDDADARAPEAVPFSYEGTLACAETGQELALRAKGSAVEAVLDVEQTKFAFGECPVRGRRDVLVRLRHPGGDRPIRFEVPPIAHFRASPSRGKLLPQQSQNLVLTFSPGQMGYFSAGMAIIVQGGANRVPLHVEGRGGAEVAPKTMTGGPGAVPQDFQPEFRFVRGDSRGEAAGPRWTRTEPWDEAETARGEREDFDFDASSEANYTMRPSDLRMRHEHRMQYADYLRASADHRRRRELEASAQRAGTRSWMDPAGKDLGMEPRSGLEEPDLPLPRAQDPLYLADADRAPRPQDMDADRPVRKVFAPRPAGGAERRDCAAALSAEERACVVVGPSVIDFGRCTVLSTATKSLWAHNGLDRPVLVALQPVADVLGESGPETQVVPAGATAGFSIRLSATEAGPLRVNVPLLINGQHEAKATAVAEAEPVRLECEDNEVHVTFPPGDLSREARGEVSLRNSGAAPARFHWEVPNGCPFRAEPASGSVDAGAVLPVQIAFLPAPGCDTEATLLLHVPGGSDDALSCTADLVRTRFTTAPKALSFGTVAVGVPNERAVTVRNAGSNAGVFWADIEGVAGASVEPESAELAPGQSIPITLRYCPHRPCTLSADAPGLLRIGSRGQRDQTLPVHADAVLPSLHVAEDEFDFGDVTVGGTETRPLRLINETAVPAVAVFDFSSAPEFTVQPRAGATSLTEPLQSDEPATAAAADSTGAGNGEGKSPQGLAPPSKDGSRPGTRQGTARSGATAARTARTARSGRSGRTGSRTGRNAPPPPPPPPRSSFEADPASVARGPDPGPWEHTRFEATVAPMESMSLEVAFRPGKARRHAFDLPVTLTGVGSPPQLKRAVVARAAKPRLLVSNTVVDFGDRVVVQEPAKQVPYAVDITLTNADEVPVTWEADAAALAESVTGTLEGEEGVFTCEPEGGTLKPRASCALRLRFAPPRPQAFRAMLPLFLDGSKGQAYMNLALHGLGIFPRLEFDADHLALPAVPLRVGAHARFHILNRGYDALDVHFRRPADERRVPLRVEFPEGRTLGFAPPRLPVDVFFVSDKPRSFATRLTFLDDAGTAFHVAVSASAEADLLTAGAFVEQHTTGDPPALVVDAPPDAPDTLVAPGGSALAPGPDHRAMAADMMGKSKKDPRRSLLAVAHPPAGAGKEQRHGDARATQVLALLSRWLPACTAAGTSFKDLPRDLLRGGAAGFVELLEKLSGKRVRTDDAASGPAVQGGRAALSSNLQRTVSRVDACLAFLKTHGAHVHHLSTASLLGAEDSASLQLAEEAARAEEGGAAPMDTSALSQRRAALAETHARASPAAWASLLLQAAKVFVLGRVTPKQMEKLPGIADSEGGVAAVRARPAELNGSPLHSAAELLLLRWLAVHRSRVEAARARHTESPRTTKQAADAPEAGEGEDKELERIASFGELADGAAFGAAILSHVPRLGAAGQPLADLVPRPSTQEDAERNAEAVAEAMASLPGQLTPSVEDILKAGARELLLWTMALYQLLPQLLPRATVKFPGLLGEEITKRISLRNPSSRAVRYDVVLEAPREFSVVSGHAVELGAGEEGAVTVAFRSRFSEPTGGSLTLLPRTAAGSGASILAFALAGEVTERGHVEEHVVKTPTYSATTVTMEVSNPFEKDAEFEITLNPRRTRTEGAELASELLAAQTRARRPLGRKAAAARLRKMERDMRLPEAFWTGRRSLRIARGASRTLDVQFLPCVQGDYECEVVLRDAREGEFAHRITGTATLPEPTDSLRVPGEAGTSSQHAVRPPLANPLLLQARLVAADRMPGSSRTRAREDAKAQHEADRAAAVARMVAVTVESPFFSCPNRAMLGAPPPDGSAGKQGEAGADAPAPAAAAASGPAADRATLVSDGGGGGANSISLTFQPATAGTYPAKLVARSPLDVRVFALEGQATATAAATRLDFTVAARQKVTQAVPIVNGSGEDWRLSVKLEGGGEAFTVPRDLSVPAGDQALLEVTFTPPAPGAFAATLRVSNPGGEQEYVYELAGQAEEPVSEEHVVIECTAREATTRVFSVPNPTGTPQTFDAETDLVGVSGAATLSVPARGSADYTLTARPLVGGTYAGALTFRAPDGALVWWTVEIRAEAPPPEQELEVASAVRSAVAVEVEVENPLSDEDVAFDVICEGEGLVGDDVLRVPAGASAAYELAFCPLLPGSQEGSISFQHPRLGEVWYKLLLKAEPQPPQALPVMRCAVGASCRQSVAVTNPTGRPVTLEAAVEGEGDDAGVFSLPASTLQLRPYEEGEIMLEYTPSALEATQRCTLRLWHEEAGEWEFKAEGVGSAPGEMATVVITAPVGMSYTHSFPFRNPFDAPLSVAVTLCTEGGEPLPSGKELELLLQAPTLKVPPGGSVEVPLMYNPQRIAEHRAVLFVRALPDRRRPQQQQQQQLVWRFPVHAVAEARSAGQALTLRGQCRVRTERLLEVELPDVGDLEEAEDFDFELDVPAGSRAYTDRFLRLQGESMTLRHSDEKIKLRALFAPMRPFSTHASLLVHRRTGGRWKFDLYIEAEAPEPDDEIVIEAAIQRTASVAFALTAPTAKPAEFEAFFSPDSPFEMSVFPTQGILPPPGTDGTRFVVSFTPREYGKTLQGTLVVRTDGMQWTYRVKGQPPRYRAPVGEAKVTTQ